MTNSLPHVQIYSDWWANPNPGPGGYGVIMCFMDIRKEFSQWYTETTNNRMELTGVITGLQKLNKKSRVDIYTDSQYTINGISKGWAEKWEANNWMRTKSEKAVNHDLWAILLPLTKQHEVTFHWVKGHNGHIENERCDELATLAIESQEYIKDDWYEPKEVKQNTVQQKLNVNSKKTETSEENLTWELCRKCNNRLEKKVPKHTKKTLEKKYFYAYYHHCPACKTNYMLEEAKRDISELRI